MNFRNPHHAPFSPGFIPPNLYCDQPTKTNIAGLQVEFSPAPSDADDSVTIWFPELKLCVNNLAWPALFNVFPIRGEEYRDPRILLKGVDHLISLEAEHLVGAHGPPISGAKRIRDDLTDARDAIQFMWDQTVRGINKGLSLDELGEFVKLPQSYARSYFTRQYYGVVEHHTKQIFTGLRGWFDGDEARLFPLPPAERATRLIAGFGGATQVRTQAHEAIRKNDLRWALELASWLVRSELDAQGRADAGTKEDRGLLASVLRAIAQRTTAANIRNWCLTRALELEEVIDISRFRRHRFSVGDVMSNEPAAFVKVLRLLVDPAQAEGVSDELAWCFKDGTTLGLHLRHCVAVPTDGQNAELKLHLELQTWAQIVAGKMTFGDALSAGAVTVTGDLQRVRKVLACFEHSSLS